MEMKYLSFSFVEVALTIVINILLYTDAENVDGMKTPVLSELCSTS